MLIHSHISLSASDWVLHSLSANDDLRPKGTVIKKKLSERLMYFGWLEGVSQPEVVIEACRRRAEDMANQRL